MTVSTTDIKELREKTGAGVMDCRNALLEAGGNIDKAFDLLKERGMLRAEKRASREATQGLVASYVHHSGNIGALVEVNCETDFVARTEEFKDLARDMAMQVAASAPRWVSPSDNTTGETADAQCSLLLQPFIKDPAKTVQDVITAVSAKTGEAVRVRRFVRFELGE